MRYKPFGVRLKQDNNQWWLSCQLIELVQRLFKEKTTTFDKKKVQFHRDNTRLQTCVVTMAKFTEMRYELLPYSPYSPELASRNYSLFPILKKWFANDEIIAHTNAYLEDLDEFYNLPVKKLEKHWTKNLELKGDYVEDQNIFFVRKPVFQSKSHEVY